MPYQPKKKAIPVILKVNLEWLFDPASKESHHRSTTMRHRCDRIRLKLSSHELLRWAMLTPVRKWQKMSDDGFLKDIRRVSKQETQWSSEVVEYLKELSVDRFQHVEDFKSFYYGISHPPIDSVYHPLTLSSEINARSEQGAPTREVGKESEEHGTMTSEHEVLGS
jgi:hypothetical protein